MSLTFISQFRPGRKLTPYIVPEAAVTIARPFQASQTITKGQPLGEALTAVNAVQTLSQSSSPSAGTFTLSFNGFTTAAIAYNAAAAAVQAALEALPSIGVGNVAATGGALPGTPVVLTFQGALAGQPVSAITVNASGITGGSFTVAQTTIGVRKGGVKGWTGTIVAAPVAPTVTAVAGGTFFGDGAASFPYLVQVSLTTSAGETTPSPAAQVLITAANRTIRLGAIASVGANVTGAKVYVNGALAATIAASGGNIPQTDIATMTGGGTPSDVNTAINASDGSDHFLGFALCDIATDAQGGITLGDAAGGEHGQVLTDAPVYISGYFRMGDLTGIDSTNGPRLSSYGRFMYGTYADAEAIFKLA